MLDWDKFIGSRQITELHLRPNQRSYHRLLPFPPSVRDSIVHDPLARGRIIVDLHHQLLTGVVVYVSTQERSSQDIDLLERINCSVVRKRILLVAQGQYWRSRIDVEAVTANKNWRLVEDVFEEIHSEQSRDDVYKLYYKWPDTFEAERWDPVGGVKLFLLYLQNYKCPICCTDLSSRSCKQQLDHTEPIDSGGTHTLINLEMLCSQCNREKSNLPPASPTNFANVFLDPRWKPVVTEKYRCALADRKISTSGVVKFGKTWGVLQGKPGRSCSV